MSAGEVISTVGMGVLVFTGIIVCLVRRGRLGQVAGALIVVATYVAGAIILGTATALEGHLGLGLTLNLLFVLAGILVGLYASK